MKSGNIVLGFERVKDGIKKSEICLLMKTSDFKNKSVKDLKEEVQKQGIKAIELPYSMDDINMALGRYSGIIGVRDKKCAERLVELIRAENGEEFDIW